MIRTVLWIVCMLSALGFAQAQQSWEVSGTIRSDSRPVKGIRVRMYGNSPVASALTDSQGSYSIKGEAPGQYRIEVQKKEDMSAPKPRILTLVAGARVKADFLIPKTSVIAGRVLDRDGHPVTGLIVEAFQKTIVDRRVRMRARGGDRTNDLGEYRIPFLSEGAYVVAVTNKTAQTNVRKPGVSTPAGLAYPPITFHPASRELRTAEVLVLRQGVERTGIDITLRKEPTQCVSFTIGSGFQGGRAGAAIRERLGFVGPMVSDARVAAGESYEVCGLPAGKFQLTAISIKEGTKAEIPGGVELARNLQILGYGVADAMLGREDLDMGTVEPLRLSDVQGVVSVKDASREQPIPKGIRIRLVASELQEQYADRRPATAGDDGAFTLKQVYAGDYAVRVDVPEGYYVIGASQQGRRVLDGGFRPENGQLQVKLSPEGCRLAGRVLDRTGTAISDVSVILIPDDPNDLIGPHVTQSDQYGMYRFERNLAPGSYRLVAQDGLVSGQPSDEAIIATLSKHGTELKLSPRESKLLDVTAQLAP